RELSGTGKKSEANILQGIKAAARQTDRASIGHVYPLAHEMLDRLLQLEPVERGSVAGSLRRYRDTIGDVDLLVAASMEHAADIMEAFKNFPEVSNVLVSGETKTSVELCSGLQVDLRVLPPERYGTLLVYFTGSKDHNVRLRERALARGWSLNEHEFQPTTDDREPILCATEEEVYRVLGMAWVPPELRENRGEIEAAAEGTLPDLITLADLRCDLQMHTTFSDGKTSVLEMAQAAADLGYEYILITDHSHGLGVVDGLHPEQIAEQRAAIDAANEHMQGRIRILHGVEVEIKANGELDYDDETLARFDLVQGSIHTSLRQPREQITERLLAAMRNPYIAIIGHPRGRLYPDREPADLDMDRIYNAAVEYDVALEINANPMRLDLDASHARRAVELGVKLSISTDAHHPDGLRNMHYGVGTARRGWVTAPSVINTWPLEELLDWAERRRQRATS
ncbi:MAG: DNA polymerase/3'-5' exonuclease PolX, partial [Anaerolineae bacterium]